MANKTTYIYGKHALAEALEHAPEVIEEVLFASNFQGSSLKDRTKNKDIPIHTFGAKHPPGGVKEEDVHQGVVIRINANKLMQDYDDFIANVEVTPATSLVLLGEVQDPQNVGAVIRSAAAFGVGGVLIPQHDQAQVTPAVVKVSAGMAFRTPLVSIGNVNTTIRDLKERGFWIYGLEGTAQNAITDLSFETPTVFVLGNEATGIREKTKEHCDVLTSIPVAEGFDSLNAAVSAAIAFYTWRNKQ